MPTDAPKVKVAGGLEDGATIVTYDRNTESREAIAAEYNDHQMSLRAGHRVSIQNTPHTLCEAIMTPTPGELTWPINSKSLRDVFTVTDEECLHAMKVAYEDLNV